MNFKYAGSLASALFILGTSAFGQTSVSDNIKARLVAAAEKIKEACGPDINKFCNTVTPGEDRLIFCMMAHEDKISTKCDYALYSASRNMDKALGLIEQASDMCWSDIEKNCSNMPEGSGGIAQCLFSKKATLTRGCQTVLEQFPTTK